MPVRRYTPRGYTDPTSGVSSSTNASVTESTMSCHMRSDAQRGQRNVLRPFFTTAGAARQRVHLNVSPRSIQ
jgi:hypothetical protein